LGNNNELEYYTNRQENAYVSNGTLKIVLKKEAYQGFNYTSADYFQKENSLLNMAK
jgi:hypothetical protein